jgi:hypothetical protein
MLINGQTKGLAWTGEDALVNRFSWEVSRYGGLSFRIQPLSLGKERSPGWIGRCTILKVWKRVERWRYLQVVEGRCGVQVELSY